MNSIKLLVLLSCMTLQLIGSEKSRVLMSSQAVRQEKERLRTEIAEKNKTAYRVPLIATPIGFVAGLTALSSKDDAYGAVEKIKCGTLLSGPLLVAGATYAMPKPVVATPNDTLAELRRKSKQCDRNIDTGAQLGFVRGVGLVGTYCMTAGVAFAFMIGIVSSSEPGYQDMSGSFN